LNVPVRLKLLLAGAACVGLPALAQTWQVPRPSRGLMPKPTMSPTSPPTCASGNGRLEFSSARESRQKYEQQSP
jgi:hypothetical protein